MQTSHVNPVRCATAGQAARRSESAAVTPAAIDREQSGRREQCAEGARSQDGARWPYRGSHPAARQPAVASGSRSRRSRTAAALAALCRRRVGCRVAGGRPGAGRSGGAAAGGVAPGDLNVRPGDARHHPRRSPRRYGAAGARRDAAPRRAGRRRGVLFEHAASVTPLTLPAHSSMLHRPAARAPTACATTAASASPTSGVTLAEVLARARLARPAASSPPTCSTASGGSPRASTATSTTSTSPKYKVVSAWATSSARATRWSTEALPGWIGRARRGERFFAWVHLYDPHTPYDAARALRQPLRRPRPTTARSPGPTRWSAACSPASTRRGVAERTIVAVIGDHGESLGEHGESGHGFFIYEPTTRVPFLLAGAVSRPRRPAGGDEPVGQADLAPTLLELAGGRRPALPGEPAASPGAEALVPLLVGRSTAGSPPRGYSEAFYPRLHYGWSELRVAAHASRWHFIEAPRPELYDVEADPGETQQPRRRASAGWCATCAPALAAIDATGRRPAADGAAPVEEDEETLRKLAALGYVGSTGASTRGQVLPRPGRPQGPPRRLQPDGPGARGRCAGEDRPRRSPLLARGARRGPRGHRRLVHARQRLLPEARLGAGGGELPRDAEAPPRPRLGDDRPRRHPGRARAEIDDAVLGYRQYLEQDPKNAQILYRLAQVLLDAGRDAEAETPVRGAPSRSSRRPRAPRSACAVVAFRRQDLAGSRRARPGARHRPQGEARALQPRAGPRGRGGPAGGGRAPTAPRSPTRPDAYKAHFNLGRLLGRTGRPRRRASTALRRAVEANPEFGVGHSSSPRRCCEAGDLEAAKPRPAAASPSTGGPPRARSATTCWPTSSTARAAAPRPDAELRRGRAAERRQRAEKRGSEGRAGR